MSNRSFFPLRGSLHREAVMLMGQVTTSTSGAIASQKCKGFSVARTGAGVYVVTLENAYAALLDAQIVPVAALNAAKGAVSIVTAEAVATTPSVTITLLDGAHAAADPVDGAVLLVSLKLSRVPV